MNPPISIIIPVFNSEHYLAESIGSVLRQTFGNFELLCVDNASTDGSLRLLRKEAEKDPRIVVLEEPHSGVSNARNTGLAHASGDYVAFIDADDFISPSLLQLSLDKARKHDTDMVIYGFDEYQSMEESFSLREVCEEHQLYERTFTLNEVPCLSTEITTPNVWRILFRRNFLEKKSIQFETDLRTAEDLAFIYKALLKGARVILLDERLYHYRRDVATSLTRLNREGDALKALDYIHTYLKECEDDASLRRHFVNLVLDTVQYGLRTAVEPHEFESLFGAYHSKWHSYIAANETIVASRYKPFFDHMERDSACCYAYSLYANMRAHNEETRVHLLRLEDELRNARASEEERRLEIRRLETSYAFRIGRLITFLPSRVKAMLNKG